MRLALDLPLTTRHVWTPSKSYSNVFTPRRPKIASCEPCRSRRLPPLAILDLCWSPSSAEAPSRVSQGERRSTSYSGLESGRRKPACGGIGSRSFFALTSRLTARKNGWLLSGPAPQPDWIMQKAAAVRTRAETLHCPLHWLSTTLSCDPAIPLLVLSSSSGW